MEFRIMKNLDQKSLLYEHLFQVIRKRTYKMIHDVEIEDSNPVKSHPYRMYSFKQEHIKRTLNIFWRIILMKPSKSD